MAFDPTSNSVVIIKGGSNIAAIWFSGMTADHWKPLSGGTALQTSGGVTPTATGFTVTGSTANTNASGTSYRWTAFQDNGAGDFGIVSYTGNGANDRSIPISGVSGVTPDFAMVASTGALAPIIKFKPQSGDASQATSGQAAADQIQLFESGGIQVGTSNSVNANTVVMYGFAVANSAIFHALAATWAGDSVNDQTRAHGAGFTPTGGWVKATAGVTQNVVTRHPAHTSTNSGRWSANADGTTGIRGLDATNITVSSNDIVNGTGGTYAALVYVPGTTSPVAAAGHGALLAGLRNRLVITP
jgi:hypothetical protein